MRISYPDDGARIQIPTLLASDGSVYFGSQAIAQYLDLYAGGDKLFKSGKARMEDVMLESVADGLLDAALQLRYETTIRVRAITAS